MLPLRDRLFLGSDIVLIAGPIGAAALSAADGALGRLAAAPGWGWLARPFPRGRAVPDLTTAVLDPGLDDAGAVRAAIAVERVGPARLAVCGDRIVLALSHAAADGVEAVALLDALLVVMGGEPAPRPEAPVRFPLVRAIRRVGPAAFLAYARARADRAERTVVVPAPPPTPAERRREGARLVHVRLDGAQLAALRRVPAGGGRATTATRLMHAVVHALRESATDERDLPVRVPVDLRPFAGGRVRGTFVSVEPHGGLRSADWAPGAIAARIAAGREQGVPALAAAVLRGRRPRRRAGGAGECSVSVSVLPEPTATSAWADGEGSVRGATLAPRWPSSTFVLVTLAPGRAGVSVWDEAGGFDLDRFAEVLSRPITVAAVEVRGGSGPR